MKLKKLGNTETKVFQIAKPLADELGLDIWDVCFEKEGASWYLRVFIDKQDGVTIEDCENLTRPLNKLLDEDDFIKQSYIFEVGSAGLERELKSEEHFRKSVGEKVTVRLIRPFNNQKEFVGTLSDFDKDTLSIVSEDTEISFTFNEVAFVKLVDEFEF